MNESPGTPAGAIQLAAGAPSNTRGPGATVCAAAVAGTRAHARSDDTLIHQMLRPDPSIAMTSTAAYYLSELTTVDAVSEVARPPTDGPGVLLPPL